jgi:hypothetical protein
MAARRAITVVEIVAETLLTLLYMLCIGEIVWLYSSSKTRRLLRAVPVPSRSVPVRLLVLRKAIISCAPAPNDPRTPVSLTCWRVLL